jgi:hypothetical protein
MYELISAVGELIFSWRFYLCAVPGIAIAVTVGTGTESQLLAWLVAAPSVLAGVGGGLYWEWKAK